MLKNFHWGHGIALFYIVFVGAVISVLIASFGVDHSLVDDEYYQKDMNYQNEYNSTVNSLQSQLLSIEYLSAAKKVVVKIDQADKVNGMAYFYRPSDKSQDFDVMIKDNKLTIPTQGLVQGKWIVKVDAVADGKSYYKEEMLLL